MSMAKDMEILIVEPGKAPRPAVIPNTLDAVEKVLCGPVQIGCFLPQKVLLISREDMDGLPPNRCLPGKKSSINGIFLLCGVPEEGDCFASLTPGQQKDFQDIFQNPGEFMMIGGKMYADPDDVADTVYGLWDTLQDGETVVLTKWGGSGKRETA